jgi:hypothetical protein
LTGLSGLSGLKRIKSTDEINHDALIVESSICVFDPFNPENPVNPV